MKTREWLLVILLIVISQLFLHVLSIYFSGSVRALGYISFAGTMVSILLGLIAIIYAVGQTISQSNSSSELRAQVERIVNVSSALLLSKDEIEKSSKEVSRATEELALKMSETIGAANNISTIVHKIGNGDWSASKDKDLSAESSLEETDSHKNSPAEKGILELGNGWTTCCCHILGLAVAQRWSLDEVEVKILPIFEAGGMNVKFMSGAMAALSIILESEEVLRLDNTDGSVHFLAEKRFDEWFKVASQKIKDGSGVNTLKYRVLLSELDIHV